MSAPNVTAAGPTTELDDYAKQEIRIAAVLNGGVSLAVWMSGVVIELHHVGLSSLRLGSWQPYRQVLDLLGATARVDVIAGTSAGGLNGAFLALGIARRRDLTLLRDVWANSGALETLLHPAMDKQPAAVLRGDAYFLEQIRAALTRLVSVENPDLGGDAALPVELILTGTLWSGRESTFTDDMGVGITERDYDATFRFANQVSADVSGPAGDLDDPSGAVLEQLARASRCTSSFPAAFEPHLVTRTPGVAMGRRWPTSAGQANFENTQYVLDGGVLLNKPVRPALEAIYRQRGENQIRRVLAYVVPDPGEPPPQVASTDAAGAAGPTPPAGEVLLSVLTRLRSTDSVARELGEIRDRNQSVRERRRTRARLCTAMTKAQSPLAVAMWDGYLSERIDQASTTIGRLIAAGQPDGPGAWSEREIIDALARYAAVPPGFGFVPQSSMQAALAASGAGWRWGQTTVLRLLDMTVDLLRRALWLAPLNSPDQAALVQTRRGLEDVLRAIQAEQADLIQFWQSAARGEHDLPPIPPRVGAANTSARHPAALDTWLAPVIESWDNVPSGAAAPGQVGKLDQLDEGAPRRAGQYRLVLRLASALFACRDQVDRVRNGPNGAMDPSGGERAHLTALYEWLLLPAASAEDVLARMLELDVVLVASAGALAVVEQEVELVQVSCSNREVITGMQLYHFGAFYRAPWRVNDWIEGRLDGAKQVMRFLLAPDRLRQRAFDKPTLLAALKAIAVPVGSPDEQWLLARWNGALAGYTAEVETALAEASTTTALDGIADALAMPLRLQILRDDLVALAAAIRGELTDAPAGSKQWLASYQAKIDASPPPVAGNSESSTLSAGYAWDLRTQMAAIGSQRITDDIGSDTFARTVSHAATVAASTFGAPPKVGKVRAVRFVLAAIRGYTAMVWAMVSYLTKGSEFGTRIVNLAVAVGGTLLAVTIFVPSVPIGLTLAGVTLILAGASAAALRTEGGGGLGWRLLLAALLVGGAFGYLIWRDIHEHGVKGDVITVLIKVGVAAMIVLLGWFVATAGRKADKQ